MIVWGIDIVNKGLEKYLTEEDEFRFRFMCEEELQVLRGKDPSYLYRRLRAGRQRELARPATSRALVAKTPTFRAPHKLHLLTK
jgi:hypothetical protein